MDSNSDHLRMQLELLHEATDPNPSTEFNTTNTNIISTSMNSNTNNTFYLDEASVFSLAPVNIPITSNMAPAMLPTPSFPIPTPYTAAYYNDSFPPPPQNSEMLSSPPSENPDVRSSPWIQIPANITSPPMQNNLAMLPSPTVVQPPPPNWEAISAYLRGHVRPSTDVERVFRCNMCGSEFPNAQALGGHKGSHRKRGKASSSEAGSSKKARRR